MFSNQTSDVLTRAGWTSGRSVDISMWLAALLRDGYEVAGPTAQFLTEFGGLLLRGFDLDPAKVTRIVFPDSVNSLSRAAGESLCPVGIDEPYTVLLMGATGSLYVYDESSLLRLGDTSISAIEVIACSVERHYTAEDIPLEPWL